MQHRDMNRGDANIGARNVFLKWPRSPCRKARRIYIRLTQAGGNIVWDKGESACNFSSMRPFFFDTLAFVNDSCKRKIQS
jgi:hypothetical protein